MQKPAATQYPIHDLLKTRWSPRAFSDQPVDEPILLSLFEAARWSPSANNAQPWAFVVATQDDPESHAKLVETLIGFNALWAGSVPVLVLVAAWLNPQAGPANRYAFYDVGQAVAHLSVQATALGLHVHQMAGFDAAKARDLFAVPDDYEPITVIAIGYLGDPAALQEALRERELAPRTRKSLTEFVHRGRWNR
jgi:nitroreductase